MCDGCDSEYAICCTGLSEVPLASDRWFCSKCEQDAAASPPKKASWPRRRSSAVSMRSEMSERSARGSVGSVGAGSAMSPLDMPGENAPKVPDKQDDARPFSPGQIFLKLLEAAQTLEQKDESGT